MGFYCQFIIIQMYHPGPHKRTAMTQAAVTLWGKIATLFLFATWMFVLIFYMLKSHIYDTSI